MDILITEPALEAIRSTVGRACAAGLEYGGSLLASDGAGQAPLIAYALPTGPAAAQGAAHLTTDAAFQNRAITAVRRRLASEPVSDRPGYRTGDPRRRGAARSAADPAAQDQPPGRQARGPRLHGTARRCAATGGPGADSGPAEAHRLDVVHDGAFDRLIAEAAPALLVVATDTRDSRIHPRTRGRPPARPPPHQATGHAYAS